MKIARGLQAAVLAASVAVAGCATRHSLSDVNTLFLIADRSRDGLISRSEFIGYSIAEAFRRTDTQRDGVLTLAEFTAVGGSQSTFRAADRSGAGRVTVNDAQRTPVLQQQIEFEEMFCTDSINNATIFHVGEIEIKNSLFYF